MHCYKMFVIFQDSSFPPFRLAFLSSRKVSAKRLTLQSPGSRLATTRCQFQQHSMHDLLCKSVLRSFSLITVWLCNFWHNNIGTKAACEMLMKLTTGINFVNFIQAVFCQYYFYNEKIQT